MSQLLKNIEKGSTKEIELEEGFWVSLNTNYTEDEYCYAHQVHYDVVQFHFCLKGKSTFYFNQGNYAFPVIEEQSLLLYNPKEKLPINLSLEPGSSCISILVSLKKLHQLFSQNTNYIDFLSDEKQDKKYYKQGENTSPITIVLNQILNSRLHPTVEPIYIKAKAYELFSLYFDRPEEANTEQCPFLNDEDNVRKIKLAKEILLDRMNQAPTLNELADEVGLSLKKLKEGFKEIYGQTVYAFLLDHKMNYARKLLEKGDQNVNEIGLSLGYSTSSHFIAAFKRKFGITPKKYIQSK
jgi:AraC-like DNA-binding protein